MRNYKTLGLLAVICGGLALISVAQRKPVQQQPSQRPMPIANPRVQQEPVRQLFEEMFSAGRYEKEGQVFEKGCTVHFGNRTVPLQAAVAEGKGWRNASPDLKMSINQITVKGEMVMVSWTARGTHTGQGHGLKPSGKRIFMQGRSEFKVVNGKIVEAFNEEYRPELFRQIGVSKTQALMFFSTERVLAALDPILPNRVYGILQ
jgi:predicted ester cyclase